MSYRAVVDACALYPFGVRDTLLALAELEFYDVLWSERILGEMSRNLVQDRRMTQEQVARTIRAMSDAFPDAIVSSEAAEHCAALGVHAIHPDKFLLTLLAKDRPGTIACLRRQAQILKRPTTTFEKHLDGLSLSLGEFVAAVRG